MSRENEPRKNKAEDDAAGKSEESTSIEMKNGIVRKWTGLVLLF